MWLKSDKSKEKCDFIKRNSLDFIKRKKFKIRQEKVLILKRKIK